MKIIQSYWSKPSEETKNKIGRNSGGWLDKHFHYMSWALSCLKFKEFYSDVELYTDAKGKDFLIDKLKLPYTKVENCLDCLNDYNPLIWAVGKIHTYSLQTAPFIHADNDVFIWKKFGEAFETQLLIAQSFSYSYPRLKPLLDSIFKELKFIPSAIRNDYKNENVTDSLCVGIVGGNDIAFIQAFSKKCLEFIDKNLPNLEKIDAKNFTDIAEEYFLLSLAREQGIEVKYYKHNVQPDFGSLMRFSRIPNMDNFIHLAGDGKRNTFACEQVEMRLMYEFPEYHKHILSVLSSENADTKDYEIKPERRAQLKSIYDFMNTCDEEKFMSTSFILSKTSKVLQDAAGFKMRWRVPQSGAIKEEVFGEWTGLLYYFSEPLSGNDLLEVLSQNASIMQTMNQETLKEKIIDLLSENLMYTGIIDLA